MFPASDKCPSRGLSKINLAKEDLDLKQRQITFCENSARNMAKALGLTDDQEQLIDQRVQGNPVMKLKILLSVFRRVKPLAEKQAEGKLKVTGKEKQKVTTSTNSQLQKPLIKLKVKPRDGE